MHGGEGVRRQRQVAPSANRPDSFYLKEIDFFKRVGYGLTS